MTKLCLIALSIILYNLSYAQIKMNSSGNVGIGHNNPNAKLVVKNGTKETKLRICNGEWGENYGLTFRSFDQDSAYNGGKLHVNSDANFQFSFYNGWDGEYRVGIGKLNPDFTLDVYGVAKVNGKVILTSDIRLKENILDIDNNLNIISKLRPVKYYLKNWDLLQAYSMDPIIEDSTSIEDQMKSANKRVHYGFIAQEIKEVLPELVYEDKKGYLSIDYNGIIPLLVSAIKEQQSQIGTLQAEIEQLKIGDSRPKSTVENNLGNAQLFQNKPNPFNENTVIDYYIPDGNQKATVYVYDLNGSQKKAYDVTTEGRSKIIINGSELQPGMYLYTLIVGGKEVNTRRMILTD